MVSGSDCLNSSPGSAVCPGSSEETHPQVPHSKVEMICRAWPVTSVKKRKVLTGVLSALIPTITFLGDNAIFWNLIKYVFVRFFSKINGRRRSKNFPLKVFSSSFYLYSFF
jgi:hypothetical protein